MLQHEDFFFRSTGETKKKMVACGVLAERPQIFYNYATGLIAEQSAQPLAKMKKKLKF